MIPIGQDRASRRLPMAMWILIAANVAVFIVQLRLGGDAEAFIRRWGLIPARLWTAPSPWSMPQVARICEPVVTSMFLHGGWMHLIGNLLALRVFGEKIEDRLGFCRFLAFYLFCGIVAGLLHALIHAHSQVPTIGASGAIAGVLGAYLRFFPFAWVRILIPVFFFPVVVKLPAILYLGFWIGT